jgi:DNA-binding MarR family transcriptional regulator
MAKNRDAAGEASGSVIVSLIERLARLARAAEHGEGLNPAQWEALRYLARANRFSNSPTALTHYLGATKGTISQTIKSLERKGYVEKIIRAGERRSVSLSVTGKGQAALLDNSWTALARSADGLGGKTRRRMEKGLRSLLDQELTRGRHVHFGTCRSCRFLAPDSSCSVFKEIMVPAETSQLCAQHRPREE